MFNKPNLFSKFFSFYFFTFFKTARIFFSITRFPITKRNDRRKKNKKQLLKAFKKAIHD